MNPLVSILIPCFNNEAFVGEAIESALSQTYSNIEVIVVDDGSTDQSLDIIKSFEKKIKWLSGPNRGACAARNAALKLSQGQFIQFLDADDLIDKQKISKQIVKLTTKDIDISFCQADYFNSAGPLESNHPGYLAPSSDHLAYILSHGFGTATALHKKSRILDVGGFRENLKRAQEKDLHIRLVSRGARIHVIPDRLVHIRLHDGPRLSKNPSPPDLMLSIILNAYDENKKTIESDLLRRKIFAKAILLQSVYVYRAGLESVAQNGFKTSKKMFRMYLHPCGGLFLKAISMILGVENSEIIRKNLCKLIFFQEK